MEYVGEPIDDTHWHDSSHRDYFDWVVLFNYEAIGYVRDDEKTSLDSQKYSTKLRELPGSQQIRIKNGLTALNVIGGMRNLIMIRLPIT